jgi:PilZ domain
MSVPEKRRYQRYAFAFAAEVSSGGSVQTCEGIDIGAGGCRLTVLFPLSAGQPVRVRLRSERISLEPAGQATVAWASREPPYRVGLRFSDPLAEQTVGFIHGVLGPVRLTTSGGSPGAPRS